MIQVSLSKGFCLVDDAARGDVREGPHRQLKPARLAAPHPRLRGKSTEERERSRADSNELVDESLPGAFVRPRGGGCHILIEAWKRSVEAAREPPRAQHEQTLRVVDVPEDLADAPLAGRVAMARLLVGAAAQHVKQIV